MDKKKVNELIVVFGVLLILGILLHILFMLNAKLQLVNRKMSSVDSRVNQLLSDISDKSISLDKKFSQIERELGFLNLQVIYGKIRKDGTIAYGTNFSAFKGGVGSYGVIFSAPFAEKPTALVSIEDPRELAGLIRAVPSEAGDRIDISIFSDFNATVPADREFSFVVIGKKK
ncbi:MAG: hypothetical protein AMJ95_08225 [Omnitrophica WOR_2 bacterium SM23_72]|nr:MAG: hypothetical protein AMJ95_08225 [Omnitrophica WOR_2 bacterium SM23_72]